MTFTIGQTFELLFTATLPAAGRPGFEDRRWFRRPSPGPTTPPMDASTASSGSVGDNDISMAQDLLVLKVRSSLPSWSSACGIPIGTLDPIRHLPPRSPYDVFAAAAHLIEQGGVYHHVQPSRTSAGMTPGSVRPITGLRHLAISEQDRTEVQEVAERWRTLPTTGSMYDLATEITGPAWSTMAPLFESWWVVFGGSAERPVVTPHAEGADAPLWWRHAWRLMAIADEAAAGTIYQLDERRMEAFVKGEKTDLVWFEFEAFMEQIQYSIVAAPVGPRGVGSNGEAGNPIDAAGSSARGEFGDINSLSVANAGLVSVLPKVRTPSVGCTLRSLSHHLALLPPRGVVKGRWTPNYSTAPEPAGSMPRGVMNLVLVPLPYSLGPHSFTVVDVEDVTHAAGGKPKYGYFGVNQHWIRDVPESDILDFVDAVIRAALNQSAEIHGLVFPELSLDRATFQRVREHMQDRLPGAEILIGGVSDDGEGREGNFVAVSTFPATSGSITDDTRDTIREKHHRWKLDRSQLRDYGLLGKLSPELSWWENIELRSRQVDFTVMRRDSVVAAMICEDLARVDPCQQVIRAVGPNLVVALLMDAPQVEARWPARYATVLAEDPGCAVLTLTSRGLMTLQHRLGTYRSTGDDRVVAMWRDDGASTPIRLTCPYDAQALLLTIVEKPVCDVALDGRKDGEAKAWRYVGSVPLRLPDAKVDHAGVLGPEDVACW